MPQRISPLSEPYAPEAAAHLAAMMPPGEEPIRLFRTFAKNLPMTAGLRPWGEYYLSKQLALTMRDRELIIDRTTAWCSCEYEWGVHIARFADRVGLTGEQVASLTYGVPGDPCWSRHDAIVIEAVDSLLATSAIDDSLWSALSVELDEPQILDLCLLTGWYQAISYAANAAGVEREPWAPRFDDVRRTSA
ncbi:carboxymuconolactone decarboxylase family protein [Pseudonocardia sp. TRM90224]|uniref:carboxymuconolactone decarboxylase family protein n=1 Tax=Pseudonocardia sp. TRM90224 TaxID=2812678 RepID=UPI001E36AC83|nr:carboxymuconolactone decarboxylase family protein [Pseudonocardia sp. TRM90224]